MTVRELAWAAEGKDRAAWERTSALIAAMANAHRDMETHPRPYSPKQFNPYDATGSATGGAGAGERITADNIEVLRALCGPPGKGE